jgi:hypothetical protein
MKKSDKAFVDFVRKSLGNFGLKLNARNSKFVRSNGYTCYGFFDESQICVAKKNPKWIEVLAHEYSHFIQWKRGTELYRKCFGPTNNYADVVEEWITENKNIDKRRIKRAFQTYRAMERECEIMAMGIMQKHGIDFDPVSYAQEANCYIYMYHYMEKKRIKKFKKQPDWRVFRKMPSSMRKQY